VSREYYQGALAHLPLQREGATGSLWGVQGAALAALAIYGGLVLQAGCGDGKGLVSMLGAVVTGAVRPLILIPGKLRTTFAREFAKFTALGFALPSNLEVRAHDYISRNSTWLEDYEPDFIFIDEAHAFRRIDSARTRRLLRYLDANPTRANGGDVVFAVASGTLAATSILDIAHLAHHALGRLSPLPRLKSGGEISLELASWANALDVRGRPGPQDWQAIRPLVSAFAPWREHAFDVSDGSTRRQIAREAYDARRRSVPGMIVSDSDSVPCSLVIHTHDKPEPTPAVQRALDLIAAGYTPDGEDAFDSDAAAWRAGQQVSIGVWYRWAWERVREDGSPDREWIAARKAWNRLVRRELSERAAPSYDSPGQIAARVAEDAEACVRLGTPPKLAHLHAPLLNWLRVRARYNLDKLREHVWIDAWFVHHVVELARSLDPCIIWWQSEAMANALERAGVPVFGAGSEAPHASIICALSIDRHGTGTTHLQRHFAHCVYAEFPSSGELAEQSLARLHRDGQGADEVAAHLYVHTAPFRGNLSSALEKAEFLTLTQGRQRLSTSPIVES
jgi:hypothetical protein